MDVEQNRPMTASEAAAWLRLKELGFPDPEKTVLRWRTDGKLPPRSIGGKAIFLLPDLEAFARGETFYNPRKRARILDNNLVGERGRSNLKLRKLENCQ